MAFRGVFRPSLFLAALVAGVWFSVRAFADDPPQGEAAFLAENDKAMTKMMDGMAVKPSGDIDRDFAAMMIPHHQGAIDMALLQLKYGQDTRLKRLAQSIIVEQGQEIAYLRTLLDAPPGETSATRGVADQ